MSETRLAIVIVNRSLDAANAIIAGNNVNLTASISMAPSPFDVVSLPYAAIASAAKAKRPRYATGALS